MALFLIAGVGPAVADLLDWNRWQHYSIGLLSGAVALSLHTVWAGPRVLVLSNPLLALHRPGIGWWWSMRLGEFVRDVVVDDVHPIRRGVFRERWSIGATIVSIGRDEATVLRDFLAGVRRLGSSPRPAASSTRAS